MADQVKLQRLHMTRMCMYRQPITTASQTSASLKDTTHKDSASSMAEEVKLQRLNVMCRDR